MTRPTMRTISGTALVVGGLAFGLFWGQSLFDRGERSRLLSLGMHGLSIFLLTFGLIAMQRAATGAPRRRRLGWIGVGLCIAGLWTVLPLLGLGFALLGLSLIGTRHSLVGSLLSVGAVLFAAAYLFGTHLGDEGAAEPDTGLRIVFAVALVLIAGALALIGFRHAASSDVSAGTDPAGA